MSMLSGLSTASLFVALPTLDHASNMLWLLGLPVLFLLMLAALIVVYSKKLKHSNNLLIAQQKILDNVIQPTEDCLAPHEKSDNTTFQFEHANTTALQIRDNQTKLFTPELLLEYLQSFINFSNERQPKFALLMLKFNQLFASDSAKPLTLLANVIEQLSAQLTATLDQNYIIAKYNADTFAIVVPPHMCNAQLEIALNRLAHRLLPLPEHLNIADAKVALQSLIGISIYPLDGTTPPELIFAAQHAMQRAAKMGNNNLQFADTALQQRIFEYQTLEAELDKALRKNEVDVYYQPRISIGSNRVVGYEALLRWHSPKRGVLLPKHFLNVADETGLVIRLDQLAFKTCCAQLQQWQYTGINRGRISLNIASLSFTQADFVFYLMQQLEQHALDAAQFELELHEDILLQADAATTNKLKQLAELGFHLTLDNFGVGVSSLSMLRNTPLHSIKIAASYIKHIEHNEQQRNITASLIRLASYLQLDVIATGIENEMQAYLLHVMGCDILQGHLFSQALPASEIPDLLARENRLLRKEVS